MSTFLAMLWPFLFNWLILFVFCYAVVEYGQTYFYDETTPKVLPKVLVGSAILALVLTWTKTSYATMVTADIGKTVVLAVVSFVVFVLVFRFHPWHGFAIGLVSVLLISGFATMAVESLFTGSRPASVTTRYPSKPLRRPATTPLRSPSSAAEPTPK